MKISETLMAGNVKKEDDSLEAKLKICNNLRSLSQLKTKFQCNKIYELQVINSSVKQWKRGGDL
jgi:hypothetical protein